MMHQIQVELHKAPAKEDAGAIDFFTKMEDAGYLRFHKEPNIQWGSDCIEYAFVKVEKKFMEGKKDAETQSSYLGKWVVLTGKRIDTTCLLCHSVQSIAEQHSSCLASLSTMGYLLS